MSSASENSAFLRRKKDVGIIPEGFSTGRRCVKDPRIRKDVFRAKEGSDLWKKGLLTILDHDLECE